jgi:hypothetical protein
MTAKSKHLQDKNYLIYKHIEQCKNKQLQVQRQIEKFDRVVCSALYIGKGIGNNFQG